MWLYFHPLQTSVPLKWPSCKDPLFWSKCAEAVACTTGLPRRMGNACRHQVNSYLQKYKTLEEAEEAEEDLQINCFRGGIQECSSEEASSPVVSSTPQSLQDKNTSFSPVLAFSPHSTNSSGDAGVQVSLGDSIATVVKLLAMMSSRMSQGLLQSLFYQYMFM
ncbi:unnamed protein product [Porites evermanni]|uniref:Uncharacterized protein n=1 Tax=Porites evermanni TaxID=104178 RepID=A0ABN8PGJ5_9CNID|nr:unnamed protein product [Porites evermanni]